MEDKTILPIIGERLKARRIELGITQAQLSYTCETDPSYIRKVEKGKVNLSIVKLHELTNALGMSLSELLQNL